MSDQRVSEIVQEKILSYTNAYVTKFEVLASDNKPGIYTIHAKVTVAVEPLIKTLQINNVPTVPFDSESGTATAKTKDDEKKNALALFTDLLARLDNLVQVNIGSPQVNPSIPSGPGSAWVVRTDCVDC